MKTKTILGVLLTLWLSSFAVAQSRPEFDHTTVFVRDLQKSADFYDKVVGLERIPEPFHDGRHIWYRIGPHGQLHVVSGATAPADHDIEVHLAFRVASVSDFSAHLDKLGIFYRKSIRDESKGISSRVDGVHQTYFQDPDGYWIEVNDDKY